MITFEQVRTVVQMLKMGICRELIIGSGVDERLVQVAEDHARFS